MSSRPSRSAKVAAIAKMTAMIKSEEDPVAETKSIPKATNSRLEKEMKQFTNATYAPKFKSTEQMDSDIVVIHMNDNSVWSVSRSINFFEPPIVTIIMDDSGNHINASIERFNHLWTPVISAVKWFLTIYNELSGNKAAAAPKRTPAPKPAPVAKAAPVAAPVVAKPAVIAPPTFTAPTFTAPSSFIAAPTFTAPVVAPAPTSTFVMPVVKITTAIVSSVPTEFDMDMEIDDLFDL